MMKEKKNATRIHVWHSSCAAMIRFRSLLVTDKNITSGCQAWRLETLLPSIALFLEKAIPPTSMFRSQKGKGCCTLCHKGQTVITVVTPLEEEIL